MPSEILNYIKKPQIKRAPGREGITNKILRNLTLPVIFQITNIICNIFITGHFPDSWKHASVIPILKPGKPRSAADSYRPISLLPVLSKLAERLILSRLNNHLITNKILISQQHGFRSQLSTSHQLLRVVEYTKSGFKEKKYTGAVFLDIQKAFDRILCRQSQCHTFLDKANKGGGTTGRTPLPHLIQHLHKRHTKNTTHDRLLLRGRHCDPHSKHKQKLHHSLSPQAPSRARGLVQKKGKFPLILKNPKQSSSLLGTVLADHRPYTYRITRFPGQNP
ncbi:RNA-directed DNA polymerase from mobile element jockey [Trichonephila clavipes]|nr:RNA-directed DNA polymerase from mobile element jockey [Trichonephila clavipes]